MTIKQHFPEVRFIMSYELVKVVLTLEFVG